MRPQVRAHSKSRAASEVRGCQSYLRPKVFSLYIQDTQVASREREREIPGALLKAEDSAHSAQVIQVLRGSPQFNVHC